MLEKVGMAEEEGKGVAEVCLGRNGSWEAELGGGDWLAYGEWREDMASIAFTAVIFALFALTVVLAKLIGDQSYGEEEAEIASLMRLLELKDMDARQREARFLNKEVSKTKSLISKKRRENRWRTAFLRQKAK